MAIYKANYMSQISVEHDSFGHWFASKIITLEIKNNALNIPQYWQDRQKH